MKSKIVRRRPVNLVVVQMKGYKMKKLIRCRQKVKKQGTLGPHQRIANVRGAFRIASGYDIKNARILLVDDVMTTGATTNEIARVLRRAGVESVSVAVAARGTGV